MYHGNGRPLTNKQLVRLSLGLTILAWATQVLFSQWGYGAEVATNAAASIAPAADSGGAGRPAADAERFVAARPTLAVGATLELRSEATTVGPEVRLKQVARWSNRDAAFFEQAGELVLARLDAKRPYRVIDLAEVRKTLTDAGVNVGLVRFAGPTSVTVNRSDAKPADPQTALAKWIDAKEKSAGPQVAEGDQAGDAGPVSAALVASPAKVEVTGKPAVRSLREVLTEDLSTRLNLPIDRLQITFNAKDERLLNLCEPQFRFDLDPQKVRNLGEVIWGVMLLAGDGSQRATIMATARAWQPQAVVNRPVSARAPITAADVVERRALVDRLPDEPLLALDQAVGQQAARDLKPGVVLTGRMIESLPMARNGQLVTVTNGRGSFRVKTVARAIEAGAMGQRIKVKNETSGDVYDVVLTGPQEATLGDVK